MSRRSQVNQQRAALNVPELAFSQPAQQPVPLGLGQLVDVLIRQGAQRGWRLQTSLDPKVVRFIAICGPLEVPLDFTPEEARKLSALILKAAEVVDPQASEDEPIPCSPEAEALLSEFMAAADWGGKPTTEVASSEPALTSV